MATYKISVPDCFAHQKFVLQLYGLLPNSNIFYKLYSISLLIIFTIYPFTIFTNIIKIYNTDFNEFIFSMLFEVGQTTALICILILFCNRFKLLKLFETLEVLDELSKLGNAEYENVFINKYKDIVRKLSYVGSILIITIVICYSSLSVVISLYKEKWMLPFGSGPAMVNNNFQFIIQVMMFGTLATGLYLILFIYINVLTLICGHCKLLQKYLKQSFTTRNIFEDIDTVATENKIIDWKSFNIQLRHIIPYHVGIINTADQMEAIFALIILVFFGGMSGCLCLLIYHMELNAKIMEMIKDQVLITVGYSLMILISICGEKIITESSKIANICYEMDFADCDIRIQKSLMLIMVRSQRPLTPTLGKLRVLNLRTMLGVFQSIYTYYTFLRKMKSK